MIDKRAESIYVLNKFSRVFFSGDETIAKTFVLCIYTAMSSKLFY